nr:hypothetical protein [Armatimonas sp.]
MIFPIAALLLTASCLLGSASAQQQEKAGERPLETIIKIKEPPQLLDQAWQRERDTLSLFYIFNRLRQLFCPTPDKKLLLTWPLIAFPGLKGKPTPDDYYALSKIVNAIIPQNELLFKPTGGNVSDLIQYVLDHKRSAKISLSPLEQTELQAAFDSLHHPKTGEATPMFTKYLTEQMRYQATLDRINDDREKLSHPLPGKPYSGRSTDQLKILEDQAVARFKETGNEAKKKMETIRELSQRDGLLWWNQFRNAFTLRQSQTSSGNSFPEIQYFPPFESWPEEAGWTSIEIDDTMLDYMAKHPEKWVSTFGIKTKPRDIPRIPLIKLDNNKILEGYKVSIELKRVRIERPWLPSELFNNRAWTLDGVMPTSEGLTIHQDTKPDLPYLITGFILARFKFLATDFPDENSARYFAEINSFKSIGLGGNLLFGQDNSDIRFQVFPHTEEGKKTYVARAEYPGVEIIGFICDVLPKSPNPDPKLNFTLN